MYFILKALWQGLGNYNLQKLSAGFIVLLGSAHSSEPETVQYNWKSSSSVIGPQIRLTFCGTAVLFAFHQLIEGCQHWNNSCT